MSQQLADFINLPPLPALTLNEAELSQWLTQEACIERRNKILDALLLELALEKADWERIEKRYSEKDELRMQKLRAGDPKDECADLSLELQDDEDYMETTFSYIEQLSTTIEAMTLTIPLPSDAPSE